jgi:hypothetical protein
VVTERLALLATALPLAIVWVKSINWRILMSKEKKGNKESKKPKVKTDETKKQKKDPKRYDGLP